MLQQKALNFWQSHHKIFCKFREPCLPNNDQNRNTILLNSGYFIWSVTNTLILGNGNTIFATTVFEPLLIRAVLWKQIMVPLYLQTSTYEDFGKSLAEIAVSKIYATQAARS